MGISLFFLAISVSYICTPGNLLNSLHMNHSLTYISLEWLNPKIAILFLWFSLSRCFTYFFLERVFNFQICNPQVTSSSFISNLVSTPSMEFIFFIGEKFLLTSNLIIALYFITLNWRSKRSHYSGKYMNVQFSSNCIS